VVIKGQPCKQVDLSTSQTGKHGHSKIHLIGIDIFTGKKFESVVVSTGKSDAPVVTRDEYQLVRPIFRQRVYKGYLTRTCTNDSF
jgi:translation initiation factor 5A